MEKQTVMIIDDTPDNLKILHSILSESGYKVVAFREGHMALEAIKANLPDLILLDIMMPEIDGYDVCKVLKKHSYTSDVPVIFISALNGTIDIVRAFKAGGADYITKPFHPEEVLARVHTHINTSRMQKELRKYNEELEGIVSQKLLEISEAEKATTMALAKLTGSRDFETGKHIERVQYFCRLLAGKMKEKNPVAQYLDQNYEDNIFYASVVHDVGKVAVPDSILQKPGKLTDEEFEIIKKHPVAGAETLREILTLYPENKIIRMGIEIANYHHEKWDGTGYPEGLKGKDIPLSARIMAIADVYDALRSERPYKRAMTHEEVVRILKGDMGKHFDPDLGGIFLECHHEFEDIYKRLKE